MAKGAYGRSRGFTSFGGDTEGGVPDLTGLTSGYGQGIAREFNFMPQMEKQGATDFDIMTKLYAEQQAKQAADVAAQQKQFGEDFTIGAITGDVPLAQTLIKKGRELKVQASQNPLLQSYVNKRYSAKPSLTPVTAEEEEAWGNWNAEMGKLQQAKLGYEQRKAEAEAYIKAVAAKKEVYDIGVEEDIMGGVNDDAFARAQRRIRPYAEKQNITDWTQGKVLPILEKTADVSTEIKNLLDKPFKGTNSERFAQINEITQSNELKAKSLLENLWQQPEMQSTYDPKIKERMRQTGETYRDASTAIFDEEVLPLAKNLIINQTKKNLQDNPYALSAYNKALEFSYGQKAKIQQYIRDSQNLSWQVPGSKESQEFAVQVLKFPFGKSPNKLEPIPAQNKAINKASGKAITIEQGMAGVPLQGTVFYQTKNGTPITHSQVTPKMLQNGDAVAIGALDYAIPIGVELEKLKTNKGIRSDSQITLKPSTTGAGVDVFAIEGIDGEQTEKKIGNINTHTISVFLGTEGMTEEFGENWQTPITYERSTGGFPALNSASDINTPASTEKQPPTNTQSGFNKKKKDKE